MVPFSTDLWNDRIPPYVEEIFKSYGRLKILDVGAGAGKRCDLLRKYAFSIHAIEIREPYIELYKLKEKYDKVFNIDVLDFDNDNFKDYELIILGDIFEHLSIENAKTLLGKIGDVPAFIMVPFNTKQGVCFGNVYETHLQPDLTEEVMQERYPELEKIFVEGRFGFYKLNG